jgi:hypothetical protein
VIHTPSTRLGSLVGPAVPPNRTVHLLAHPYPGPRAAQAKLQPPMAHAPCAPRAHAAQPRRARGLCGALFAAAALLALLRLPQPAKAGASSLSYAAGALPGAPPSWNSNGDKKGSSSNGGGGIQGGGSGTPDGKSWSASGQSGNNNGATKTSSSNSGSANGSGSQSGTSSSGGSNGNSWKSGNTGSSGGSGGGGSGGGGNGGSNIGGGGSSSGGSWAVPMSSSLIMFNLADMSYVPRQVGGSREMLSME